MHKMRKQVFIYAGLAAMGLCFAVFILWYNRRNVPGEDVYMIIRRNFFDMVLDAVRRQGRVLIVDHESAWYYYLAYFARLMGISQAHKMLFIVQMGAAAAAVGCYPVVFYRLTRSLAAAVASPFLLCWLLGRQLWGFRTDGYWAYAWVIITVLPLAVLLFKQPVIVKPIGKRAIIRANFSSDQGRGRSRIGNTATDDDAELAEKTPEDGSFSNWLDYIWRAVPVFIAALLLCGLANLPRGHAALPVYGVIVVFAIIKLFRKKIKPLAILAVAMLAVVCSYNLFTSVLPSVLFKGYGYENAYFGVWHTLYIGLGVDEENPYNITFNDACANARAAELNPDAIYPGAAPNDLYFEVLKNEYTKIVRENPLFVLKTYARKFFRAVNEIYLSLKRAVEFWIVLAADVAAMLFLRLRRRKKMKDYAPWGPPLLWACGCTVFTAMLPAMIAMPRVFYMQGSFAAVRLMAVFLCLIAIVGFTRYEQAN